MTSSAEYYGVEKLNKIRHEYRVIKEHIEECKIDQTVMVKDLSLLAKGPEEDKVFAEDP